MNWLGSSWTIGIVTGILSGALITIISRFVLGRRENREYRQKVLSANQEVIYAIRPGISEGQIPTREVTIAVTNSTARRHAVSPSDLHNTSELAEELIKEVMDSSFLSSTKKSEYCLQLVPLTAPPEPIHRKYSEEFLREKMSMMRERQKNVQLASTFLGLLAALITILAMLITPKWRASLRHLDLYVAQSRWSPVLEALLVVASIAVLVWVMMDYGVLRTIRPRWVLKKKVAQAKDDANLKPKSDKDKGA